MLFMAGIITAQAGNTYIKVTSTSQLVAGDVYVIAAVSGSDKYLATGYNSSGKSLTTTSTGFSISDGILTTTATPQEFTLGGNSYGYTLLFNSTKYLGFSGSGSALESVTNCSDNKEKWTYNYDEGEASYIIANVSAPTKFLRVNTNNNIIVAATNTNTYPNANLYRKVAYTITATSSNNEWGTVAVTGNIITATPESGYRVSSSTPYTVISGTPSSVVREGNTFTVTTTTDCTIRINFEAIPTYTISWSVNGTVVDTDVLEEGAAVTFNDADVPTGCDKVFMGWVTTSSVDPNEEPTYVTSATATADIIYYAVFATESNAGVGTATLTASSSTWTGWADKELTDDKGNTWTGHCAGTEMGKDTKIYVIGLSTTAAPGSYLSSPTFPSNITSIKACIINPSGTNPRTLNIKSSKDAVTNLGTITVPASEDGSHQLTATLGEDEFTKFYLTSEEVLQIRSITVNYGTISYSDYTTTATATVSLASACTDGSRYYGTYSCTGAFVVPADLTVSEISVADDKLTVADYDTGEIVPANTGVMISSTTSGNHTIVISDAAGTSVLGSSNMLRATGSTGITAEDMASADASSLFYRLTMHGGSTLGFYWGAADGGAFAVAAQKAYLSVPVSTARSFSSFNLSDNGATIIKLITIPSALEKTYNLRGQLITTSKGLVISKGKKIVNK